MMERTRLLSLLIGLLSGLTLATSVPREVDHPAKAPRKILSSSISRAPHGEARRDVRRVENQDTEHDLDLDAFPFSSVAPLVDLKLGSSGQNTKVLIDTGSSELWVGPKCKYAGSELREAECIKDRADDYFDSTSLKNSTRDSTKPIEYLIGKAYVSYVQDDITLPGFKTNLWAEFGVATKSWNLSHGILGLGFGQDDAIEYKSVVDRLFDEKFINTRTVGIALGADGRPDDEILTFGQVDKMKFVGDLYSAPIIRPEGKDSWR